MMLLSRHLCLCYIWVALYMIAISTAQPEFAFNFCSKTGDYTNNSAYQTNLNILFSSLNANITYGFYNLSYGQEPDKIYATALCRGDVGLQDCRSCVNDSTYRILQDCPNQKEAIGWYDKCMLRYANRPIFGVMEDQLMGYICNPNNASSPCKWNQKVETLFDGLKSEAASGGSIRKYATRNTSGTGSMTIYALSECTPDLSHSDCSDCLGNAVVWIQEHCGSKEGGRVVTPSCNADFENFHFYDDAVLLPPPTPPTALPPPPPPQGKGGKKATTLIAIMVSTAACILIVLAISICILLKRRRQNPGENEIESEKECLRFDLGTIQAATANFSEENKLGQGGFGAVYKGTLQTGQEVAVKRLFKNSSHGVLEFKNEVVLVARLQHRNLVRLLGFCLNGEERLLIFEFVVNGSLDQYIFDPVKREELTWETRYKIIVGIIRGLLYLHEDSRLRIVHRDLKASNILLDAEMNPKISDFGMARLFATDQSRAETNQVAGTFGYMAPEYAGRGQFSVKSDVYSFGVLLLEIVSGQQNINFLGGESGEGLPSFAWKNWSNGTYDAIIDPVMRSVFRTEVNRCIHVGLLCVQEKVADRPTTASVNSVINRSYLTLAAPSKPAFFVSSSDHPGTPRTSPSRGEIIPMSRNEASISALFPR